MRATAGRHPRPLLALMLVLLTTVLCLAQSALGAARSEAAQDGLMLSYGGWTVGTRQLAGGEFVYCIEPGAVTPYGAQLAAAEVDELRGYSFFTYDDTGWAGPVTTGPVSGEPLRRINYVLSRYGSTHDAAEAAAVQFAVWLLRESPGDAHWLEHHLGWVAAHGGAAHLARAHELVAEAKREAVPPSPQSPAPLDISAGEEHGTGSVRYPAGTLELRIEGGVFADGSRRLTPDGGAGAAEWRAELHADGWERTRRVTIAGEWNTSESTWPARLLIYPAAVFSEQTLIWAVGPVSEPRSGAFEPVGLEVDASFSPVLSTRVVQERLVAGRDRFADALELGVGAGSAPWPARETADGSREYLPLRLSGVLYGPFAEPQPEREEPPADAPVAGRLELLADRGPGGYEAALTQRPVESGHYYWVWSVGEAEQAPDLRAAGLLPEGYRFSDRFGLPNERHLVSAPPVPEEPDAPAALARTGAAAPGAPVALGAPVAGAAMLLLGAGALLIGGLRRRLGDVQRTCSPPR